MKYTTEIIVDVPLDEFITKLDNPENMKYWQKGLVGYKSLSGKQGSEGAKMELQYKMGRRQLVLVETIIKNNFPYEFHATYDAKGVHNIQKNTFKAIDAHSTKWISESEFQFSGIMMKIMGFIMPGAFKKQSMEYLQDFKAFAEEGISVAKA
ncbi:SRPBCC family protein [Muriicola sp. Z0-33]|uniref:SRPBCC family protein n=1 Tax=Muriicola sp. Z0-33 TaxID=2816957 RepID=UPI00223719F2|nr:SRPBCC family protein [Muriicola sp. Z0-33]MCW5517353.1 SRPBCC family protein [Muriicola sp. Z0-33]